MSATYLESLVIHHCNHLGDEKAAEFFGVSQALIRQWVNGSKRPSLAAVEKVFSVPVGATEDAAWEGKEVYLCLPQYKHTNPLTLFSLLGIWDREKFGAFVEHGNAFIIHTREKLADQFLATGKPHSIWIDDDTVVPIGNAEWYRRATGIPLPDEFAKLHTANRLLSHKDKTIVGGLYFGRTPWGRATYYEAMVDSPEGVKENEWAHKAPYNSLRPTKWTGTGCIRIDRDAFLDIRNSHPHLEPMFPGEPFHYFTNASDGVMRRLDAIEEIVKQAAALAAEDKKDEAVREINDAVKLIAESKKANQHTAHLMQGEDQTFGIRAKEAGHQSWVDMGLICGHIGTAVYGPHNTLQPSPKHQHN